MHAHACLMPQMESLTACTDFWVVIWYIASYVHALNTCKWLHGFQDNDEVSRDCAPRGPQMEEPSPNNPKTRESVMGSTPGTGGTPGSIKRVWHQVGNIVPKNCLAMMGGLLLGARA
jgi:hypothetical protein